MGLETVQPNESQKAKLQMLIIYIQSLVDANRDVIHTIME